MKRTRRKEGFTPETRQIIERRSGGRCEARTPICSGWGQHIHHRKSRRAGDHSAPNGLHVCRSCHAFIHDHPELSMEKGWIIRVNDAG